MPVEYPKTIIDHHEIVGLAELTAEEIIFFVKCIYCGKKKKISYGKLREAGYKNCDCVDYQVGGR